MLPSSVVTYHSSYNEEGKYPTACGLAILPIKTQVQGPAPKADFDGDDIIDEAISQFRANVYFKNYDVRGPADKVLIYLTVYIQKVLEVVSKNPEKAEAKKAILALIQEPVPTTASAGFMAALVVKGRPSAEEEKYRTYLRQIREECAMRMFNVLYQFNGMDLKFWLGYSKRKFLKLSM